MANKTNNKIEVRKPNFFAECMGELRRVVWPKRDDVVASVKVVIVSTLIIAVLLGLLDFGFTAAFRAIMR
ncbi:MAG: preprotein translocase subunit SecE [Treponema sp.]|nr:preprotein translocase subunit SecE [Treponema sp.]